MDNELIRSCIQIVLVSMWLGWNIYYDNFRGFINSILIIILFICVDGIMKDDIKPIDTRLKQIEELIYDKPEDVNIEIT